MTRTFDPLAERDALLWQPLAAAILGIEGLRTLLYAAFLGTPIANAGVDVPVVGAMPYGWIVPGVIALIAAVGVLTGRTWGRYLGAVSAVLTIMTGLFNAPHAGVGVVALALPCIVLFVLWRKWPTTRSI
jgi:hypothetical protein